MNSTLKTLVALALVGLGLVFAVLTIGAFGQANPNNPAKIISDVEVALSSGIGFMRGESDQILFGRGFAYMGLTIVFTSLAALLLASPKSETIARPGRRARGQ